MAQQVFINELHYDNTGTDTGEGIEIAGPANSDLGDYDVYLYNGNGGAAYGGSLRLSGNIPQQSGGAGAVWFPLQNIQNGNPDGLVLYHWPTATVVQRISYGGSFTAADGVAGGMMLPDIGVSEGANTPAGQSLQLTGTGTSLANFIWTAPRSSSPGSLNAGQTFTADPVRSAALAAIPGLLTEGETTGLQLRLTPAPAAPVTYTLEPSVTGILALPAQITVPASGTVNVFITALTDGVADGLQQTIITAQPPDASWPPAAAGVQIIDADRPLVTAPGALRLMSFNARLGVGVPGSAEFNAAREIVERLSPDVLVMQEVHSANDFADFLTLAQQAGLPADAAHTATFGDAFAGHPYVSGDTGNGLDQNAATVSRYPIRQRIQCGRGIAGRVEITRYPLLSVIDVPWLPDTDDPVIVNVHLKADAGDANNFRRALEARRLRECLTAAGFSGTTDNIVITGDFNATDWLPQPVSYETNVFAVQFPGTGQFADGTTLPTSFAGGSDLTSPGFTLPYKTFPHSGFNPSGLTALSLKQADGSDERTFAFASYKLDYFFVSQPITARGAAQTEIYNSRLEAIHDGLPKRTTLPDPSLSITASDHYAIVADIPLLNQPALSVTFSREWVLEGESALTATITATPPPVAAVAISLNAWRDGRISTTPSTITLGPANPSSVLTVNVPWQQGIEPHRRVALTASAPGCYSGTGSVMVRNREASGLLVISQYHEPATGSAPRAIELLNMSGVPVDFGVTGLGIRRYSNGNADGVLDAEATTGVLPAGAVLVVGDDETGDYMVAQGLLPVPAVPFASQANHTVSLNAAGDAAFLLDDLVFNGDDALEVLIDNTRSDVFGEIGHGPGTAWTGPGAETTMNAVLALRPGVATGSSGWRQPGRRFTYSAASLSGFGIAPAIADPCLAWANAAGLSGLAAAPGSDPDRDGAPNLLEYAMATVPVDAASFPSLTTLPGGFKRRLRTNDPSLTFTVQSSANQITWQTAAGSDINGTVFPDGSVERTFSLTTPPAGRVFLRQRVSRP